MTNAQAPNPELLIWLGLGGAQEYKYYILILKIIYLKFTFNWVFYIFISKISNFNYESYCNKTGRCNIFMQVYHR
jgi:hypothetical protein